MGKNDNSAGNSVWKIDVPGSNPPVDIDIEYSKKMIEKYIKEKLLIQMEKNKQKAVISNEDILSKMKSAEKKFGEFVAPQKEVKTKPLSFVRRIKKIILL